MPRLFIDTHQDILQFFLLDLIVFKYVFVFKGSDDKGEKAPPSLKDGVARFVFMFTFSLNELNKQGSTPLKVSLLLFI